VEKATDSTAILFVGTGGGGDDAGLSVGIVGIGGVESSDGTTVVLVVVVVVAVV